VAVAPALDDSAAIIFALNRPYGCPCAGDIIREEAILHNLLDLRRRHTPSARLPPSLRAP
jgi:hypothetical protein